MFPIGNTGILNMLLKLGINSITNINADDVNIAKINLELLNIFVLNIDFLSPLFFENKMNLLINYEFFK